jgi:hypothetical protein
MRPLKSKIVMLVVLLSLAASSCGGGDTSGISFTEAARLTPLHPSQLSVEPTEQGFQLKWKGTGGDLEKILYYQIYRRAVNSDQWQHLADVKLVGDNRDFYAFDDATADITQDYVYGIVVLERDGRASERAEIATNAPTPTPRPTYPPATATPVVPHAPSQLAVEITAQGFRVTWLGTGALDTGQGAIAYYEISRLERGNQQSQFLAKVEAAGDNTGFYTYDDLTSDTTKVYVYEIVAVNLEGARSARAEIAASNSK